MNDSTTRPDPDRSEREQLLDHSRDGVRLGGSSAPRWRMALFWLAIVAAPLSMLCFHFGSIVFDADRRKAEKIASYDRQADEELAHGEVAESTLVALMSDTGMMSIGKRIFQSKCSSCHGALAQGAVGPNLTDGFWLHGPQLLDIYRTVRDGAPEKGMMSWELQLRLADLLAVSSYVGSLSGSNPPNPKPPQGTPAERRLPGHPAAGS